MPSPYKTVTTDLKQQGMPTPVYKTPVCLIVNFVSNQQESSQMQLVKTEGSEQNVAIPDQMYMWVQTDKPGQASTFGRLRMSACLLTARQKDNRMRNQSATA